MTDPSKLRCFFDEFKRNGLSIHAVSLFRSIIYEYYDTHGRKLPWRESTNPYHILVSEMMLQQTQVERVIPKYLAFLERFPNFEMLARSSTEEVLNAWQGLGYNRRALFLRKIATIIVNERDGKLPDKVEELENLPGIGRYTARAITAFAYNRPVIVIETNIRAVYLHFFFKDHEKVADREIEPIVEKTMDASNPRRWYNAVMDYGVMLKKTHQNPTRRSTSYRRQPSFKGSNREIRGKILRRLLLSGPVDEHSLARELGITIEKVTVMLDTLEKEGFVIRRDCIVRINPH